MNDETSCIVSFIKVSHMFQLIKTTILLHFGVVVDTLLHFGVVEHSLCGVDWVTISNIAKLTSFVVV